MRREARERVDLKRVLPLSVGENADEELIEAVARPKQVPTLDGAVRYLDHLTARYVAKGARHTRGNGLRRPAITARADATAVPNPRPVVAAEEGGTSPAPLLPPLLPLLPAQESVSLRPHV